jgi:hypothetical protein
MAMAKKRGAALPWTEGSFLIVPGSVFLVEEGIWRGEPEVVAPERFAHNLDPSGDPGKKPL